jgi:monothiol glutaredoxin
MASRNRSTFSAVSVDCTGTPEAPQCGFSRATVQILDLHGVPPEKMKTYNVLEDSELREGIKEFSCVSVVSFL